MKMNKFKTINTYMEEANLMEERHFSSLKGKRNSGPFKVIWVKWASRLIKPFVGSTDYLQFRNYIISYCSPFSWLNALSDLSKGKPKKKEYVKSSWLAIWTVFKLFKEFIIKVLYCTSHLNKFNATAKSTDTTCDGLSYFFLLTSFNS